MCTKESFDQRDFTASVRTCHKRPYSKREDMSKDFTTGKMLVLVSGGDEMTKYHIDVMKTETEVSE